MLSVNGTEILFIYRVRQFDFLNLCSPVYDAFYDGLSAKHATPKVYGTHADFITCFK